MSRNGRKRGDGFDLQRVVAAAAQAFLEGESGGRRADADDDRPARRRVGAGALALGVAIGLGGRALYRSARQLDLERVARAVEKRIVE